MFQKSFLYCLIISIKKYVKVLHNAAQILEKLDDNGRTASMPSKRKQQENECISKLQIVFTYGLNIN